MYFPATRQALASRESAGTLSQYRGTESILVVDDIEEQRELAFQMLTKTGVCRSHRRQRGEAAIEHLKSHSADLLVLDMIMAPGIDGLDAYKGILNLHPRQKAIITSGFSETDRVKAAQRLGAGTYLKKPYVLDRLGAAVRRELDRVGADHPAPVELDES